MTSITNEEQLMHQIHVLEARCFMKKEQLKQTARAFMESLHPVNIIRENLQQLATSPALRSGLFQTVIGLGIGFLTNRITFLSARPAVRAATAATPAILNAAKKAIQHFILRRRERKATS